jgi:orotidine-5'-phosphate decarboxylase
MSPSPKERLIIALDVNSIDAAKRLVQETKESCTTFKVGLELFTTCGPAALQMVRDEGASFFLDLKLHDIPNTVAGAVRQAQTMGARFLTLHALGGPLMLQAAADATQSPLTLLAVSVLTHHTDEELAQMGYHKSTKALVLDWLKPAYEAGVGGCVCSPEEAAAVRQTFGPDFTIVCPGIRPIDAAKNDQGRIATPFAAIQNGADYLVVGRPITQAANPALAAQQIIKEIENGLHARP